MHQFQIQPIFGQDWSIAGHNIAFTNSALWMMIVLGSILVFMLGGMKRELVPGRWQMAVEGFTGFIDNLLAANIGPAGKKYVPYIFSLFMFILFCNVIGLLPGAFTVTSHIIVTFAMAAFVFVGVTIWRFRREEF